MVKELGGEHAKFLLHSHDRIITDPESTGGPAAVVGPVAAVPHHPAPALSRANRSLSNVSPSNPAVAEAESRKHHHRRHRHEKELPPHSLSSVVTHANNVIQNKKEGRNGRLYQAVAYHQRLFSGHSTKHQVHPESEQRVITLANGNLVSGGWSHSTGVFDVGISGL
jgi:hypothetical protein